MSAAVDYPVGASVWQELRVRSAEGLADFYAAVLGLELRLEPAGNGRATGTLSRDGAIAAGVLVDPGLPAAEIGWQVFLGTEPDLDAAVARAVAAGAAVLRDPEPMLAPGRAVRLSDPFGAPFGLAVPAPGRAIPPTTRLGFLALVDPTNHDLDAEVAFQRALFPDSVHDPVVPHDVCFFRDADGLALRGSFEVAEEARPFLPPHWLPWFSVADQAAAVDAAAATGGTVNTRDNTSSFGVWGVVVDPGGGVFKTLQAARPAL
ncbi:VOC family protein [Leucobacter iarius]|uniref:VOC domain-containing protein n=1 Tax=Leucobacter iarius TaxID=333963 RepID=A0ABN2L8X1_9MICO